MPSAIDPTKPIGGVPASKADLRSNLQAAKDGIEALQSGKTDLGHQHTLGDIADVVRWRGSTRSIRHKSRTLR